MRFGLSAEQRLLAESLRRLLAETAPLERIRAVTEQPAPLLEEAWQGLTEIGAPALLVPERLGGLGLGLLDVAVVAEALGAAVAPLPFIAPFVMAPVAIALAGSPAQQQEWLPSLAEGRLRLGVAFAEHVGARGKAGVRSGARGLTGTALTVLDFAAADAYLVADADGAVYRVETGAAGLTRTALTTVDRTRSVGKLTFAGVAAERLAGSNDTNVVQRAIEAGRLALAADTLGAAQTMLDKAVAYAKERRQFNRVIGSFQAVKHLCAEMAAELEPCRALVWHAAHAVDSSAADGPLLVCHAKAHLAEVGKRVAKSATEVHGGIGFTDGLGLHLWFKRIGVNRQWLGSPERIREEAAWLQGW